MKILSGVVGVFALTLSLVGAVYAVGAMYKGKVQTESVSVRMRANFVDAPYSTEGTIYLQKLQEHQSLMADIEFGMFDGSVATVSGWAKSIDGISESGPFRVTLTIVEGHDSPDKITSVVQGDNYLQVWSFLEPALRGDFRAKIN